MTYSEEVDATPQDSKLMECIERLENLATRIEASLVLRRIAQEQSADPDTDDLTIPFAMELGEIRGKAYALIATIDKCRKKAALYDVTDGWEDIMEASNALKLACG